MFIWRGINIEHIVQWILNIDNIYKITPLLSWFQKYKIHISMDILGLRKPLSWKNKILDSWLKHIWSTIETLTFIFQCPFHAAYLLKSIHILCKFCSNEYFCDMFRNWFTFVYFHKKPQQFEHSALCETWCKTSSIIILLLKFIPPTTSTSFERSG